MRRILPIAVWLLATLVLIAATGIFALSLNHPINADLAMLHYSAWLINERNFVIYRDIFELNFPGPFLFHSLLGKLIGYDALPLRFVDLALLLALALANWIILAPLSRPAAAFSLGLFVMIYLLNGGEYVLERDFLGLVPAALAFAIASRHKTRGLLQLLGSGALSAVACSMKPNAVVLVPVMAWLLWQHSAVQKDRTRLHNYFVMLLLFFGAMSITAAIPFLWLQQSGGLPDFIDIYRHFVPVYANSRYDLWHYENSAERLQYVLQSYGKFGGGAALLSGTGLAWAWLVTTGNPLARRRILQLAAIGFAYTFYEVIAGKFWVNHMFPSAYWTAACFSLVLTVPAPSARMWQKALAGLLLLPAAGLACLVGSYSMTLMQAAHEQESTAPQQWRARKISTYLQEQSLQDNERVQILGMAGDAQAALLQARATTATRHLIDVPLYMQPESDSTKALRKELVDDLTASPPGFIVFIEEFLHPGGGNRLREFKPLYALIEKDYEIAQQEEGSYTIYRRKSR